MKICLDEILVCKEIGANQKEVRDFKVLKLGSITVYYSFDTIIGFCTPDTGLCVTENIWGAKTGRHLNMFSNKEDRLPREEFLTKLENVVLDIKING